ncbi:MAG: hypothetical protein QNJ36_16865 [Calothrix sp. MO_167.B42]|nr:hypothetical protein [Calothrix sp. MO_167.B42]
MQQLSLDLGIVHENFQTSTYDPYWDEITQEDDGVGEEPLNPESQVENLIDEKFEIIEIPQKSVFGQNENPGVEGLSGIEEQREAPGDNHPCPPTQDKFQVGDRVEAVSEFITEPQFGTVAAIYDGRTFVRWEPHGGSYINTMYLRLAPQQPSPYKSVGGQVNNDTDNFAPQQVFTGKSVGGQVNNNTNSLAPQHNGWVEKYPVIRSGTKYYYWRFVWREGTKKHRRYIGSCTSPKARERVAVVKSAIALGKLPYEILELL